MFWLLLLCCFAGRAWGLSASVAGSAGSWRVHGALPRVYGGELDAGHVLAQKQIPESYLVGTLLLSAFGLALVLISLACGVKCLTCRNRCNVGRRVVLLPNRFVSVGWLLSLASVVGVWVFSSDLSALVASGHSVLARDGLATVDHALSFIELGNSTVDRIPGQIARITDRLHTDQQVLSDMSQRTIDLSSVYGVLFADVYSGVGVQIEPRLNASASGVLTHTWSCGADCGGARAQIAQTMAQLLVYQSTFAPVSAALGDLAETIETGRLRVQEWSLTVSSRLAEIHDQGQSARDQLDAHQQDLADRSKPFIAVMVGVLCLPLLGFLLSIVHKRTERPVFARCAAALAWLSLTAFALALAALLPLLSGVSDGCVVLDYAEVHLSELTTPEIDTACATCLSNSSLADAFNLTAPIREIQDTSAQGSSESSEGRELLSSLVEMQVTVSPLSASVAATDLAVRSISLSSFGLNDSLVDENIAGLNAVVRQYMSVPIAYTRETLLAVDDGTSGANPDQHRQVLLHKYTAQQLLDAEHAIYVYLARIAQNATEATDCYRVLEQLAAQEQTALQQIPAFLDQIFADISQMIVDTFWCGWLGNDYRTLKQSICNTLPSDLGLLCLALSIAIICLSTAAHLGCAPQLQPRTQPQPHPISDQFGNIVELAKR